MRLNRCDTQVADFRVALGLSQMDLAGLLNISQSQLHKLERGYVPMTPEHAITFGQVFDQFLADVAFIRRGGHLPERPWASAARFWASRQELSVGSDGLRTPN